jgi:hypothetical protein
MDVLHYWKDLAPDLKAGRIGWFRASNDKLAEFQAGYPDYIWVFKTPPGMKGKLQLLGRLVWSGHVTAKASAPKGESLMHYDADHPHSVCFDGGDAEEAVPLVSDWMLRHFPTAVRGNFQGVNGQQALRGVVLHELGVIAKGLERRPFRAMAPLAA